MDTCVCCGAPVPEGQDGLRGVRIEGKGVGT